MVWMWYNGRLMVCREPSNNLIDTDIFEHLTGKRLNWKVREFKKVITKRINGHIKAFDEIFIKDQLYKNGIIIYKCEHVSAAGVALLIPRGNALKAVTARDTKDWEII